MAGFSTYAATTILDWMGGHNPVPDNGAALTLHVALFDGDPGDTGATGTDVTEDIRAAGRVALDWATPVGKGMGLNATLDFGQSATGPVEVSHVAVFDAATGGNLIYTWALATPRIVQEADAVSFPVGNFTVTILP